MKKARLAFWLLVLGAVMCGFLASQAAGCMERPAPSRPCADPGQLCRISPFFCPGTYPRGLEPCWPTARRPRTVERGPRTSPRQPVRPGAR